MGETRAGCKHENDAVRLGGGIQGVVAEWDAKTVGGCGHRCCTSIIINQCRILRVEKDKMAMSL